MTVKPVQILLSPLTIIFVTYVATFLFQLYVVFPVEASLLPTYSKIASLMFLPHAVRVLATAIIGPKAFFPLFPATLVGNLLRSRSFEVNFDGTSLLVVLVGAASAPAAYIPLKTVLGRATGLFQSHAELAVCVSNWNCRLGHKLDRAGIGLHYAR